jgi:hypothetical protein
MAIRKYILLFFVFAGSLYFVYGGDGNTPIYGAIILFQSAPNPTPDKCLIRTYLPESDPNSSLRILNRDSTLVKEIPLAGQIGISSTPIDVSDWKSGIYLYQLFYKGETRSTLSFSVKH